MNKYDKPEFFEKFTQLKRCKIGLDQADDWPVYKSLLPNFKDKRVLNLGCGSGIHSEYAAAQGASEVVGIDLSFRMIEKAKSDNYISDIDYPENSFDAVMSSMAFHYVPSYDGIVKSVKKCLVDGGDFVFSVTNPIFTASPNANWHRDEEGTPLYWPVDNYFKKDKFTANFLDEDHYMYHRTMSTLINTLIDHGFKIVRVAEPEPRGEDTADFNIELEEKRPRFLIIAAQKIKL